MQEKRELETSRLYNALQKNDDTSDRELVITRLLNAPVELVWKVWTEPEHIKNW